MSVLLNFHPNAPRACTAASAHALAATKDAPVLVYRVTHAEAYSALHYLATY